MARIGTQTISHRILRVSSGGGGGTGTSGGAPTFIEGGSDRWLVEPASLNPSQVYSTVVEQLALQGYRLVSVENGISTLQLDSSTGPEDAGATSLYIVERVQTGTSLQTWLQRAQPQQVALEPSSSQSDQALLASAGLNGLRPEQASVIVSLVQQGQMIAAIKEVRVAAPTLGLKEAKDVADNLQAALGIPKPPSGCGGTAMLALIFVGLVITCLVRL